MTINIIPILQMKTGKAEGHYLALGHMGNEE